jgi:hypothetical protein
MRIVRSFVQTHSIDDKGRRGPIRRPCIERNQDALRPEHLNDNTPVR